jgi:hypothetical protein
MVTQVGNIAVNNGNATGSSTLPIPIDRTLPHWISHLGSRFGNTTATDHNSTCIIDGMTDDDTIAASRSASAVSQDALVSYLVLGVPLA